MYVYYYINLFYQRYDDYDLRTDSSLSWGEDEFEGEATRIVNGLFQQLDNIIYEDDILIKSIHIPVTTHLINKTKQKPKKKTSEAEKPLRRRYKSKSYTDLSIEETKPINNNLSSSELSLNEQSAVDLFEAPDIPQPSTSLISECKDWVEKFPHLRYVDANVVVVLFHLIHLNSSLFTYVIVQRV